MSDPTARVYVAAERVGSDAFGSIQADLGKLGTAATVIGATVATALVALTKASFSSIDALAKVSDRLGIATEQLAALRLAGDLAGVSAESLDDDLTKMTKSVSEAAAGTGQAKAAFKELGLSARELTELPLDQQFRRISESLSELHNASDRVRLTMEIFGRGAADLIPLIQGGSAALDEAARFAEKYGLAISRVDAAKVEQANDAVTLAAQAFRGLGNVIAVEVAPVIEGLAKAFLDTGVDAKQMHDIVRSAVDGIAYGVGLVADAFYGWQLIFAGARVGMLELGQVEIGTLASIEETAIAAGRGVSKFFEEITDAEFGEMKALEAELAAHGEIFPKVIVDQWKARLAELKAKVKVEVEVPQGPTTMRQIADSLQASAEEAVQVFQNLASAEKPSVGLADALQRAREESQALAAQTAAIAEHGAERDAAPMELLLIDEKEIASRRIEVWRSMEDEVMKIVRAGGEERYKFLQLNARQQASTIFGEIANLTAGVAQQNKVMFELNKAAALAQAALDLPATVMKAYLWGTTHGGPIVGGVMAAIAAAAQLTQINAIRSTSFSGGGGGTTPSLAGSVPVVNDQPVQMRTDQSREHAPMINVTIYGGVNGLNSHDVTQQIADNLRDLMMRTDGVLIDQNSRNAAMIRMRQ